MTDRPSFTNQQINTIVPNGNVDPSFLFYSLLLRKSELLSLGAATGVRTPILNKSAFCDIKVKIPVLPLQRRIAGILSAYDDLIENNQRRIKILEEMAQSLYREWFVHFRFPGHDKVKMVSSPLGSIPQGWGGRFGDLVDLVILSLSSVMASTHLSFPKNCSNTSAFLHSTMADNQQPNWVRRF